jgi:hypothetical protein
LAKNAGAEFRQRRVPLFLQFLRPYSTHYAENANHRLRENWISPNKQAISLFFLRTEGELLKVNALPRVAR